MAGKKNILVLDAKYRLLRGIGDEDLDRLFRYMIDYGDFSPEDKLEGVFLHVDDANEMHITSNRMNPHISVHLLSIKPSMVAHSKNSLKKVIEDIVSKF